MNRELATLARTQAGVWTWHQALRCGYTVSQARVRVRRGDWRRVRHGVYCSGAAEPGQVVRGAALALAAPSGTVLSHSTAAAFHGFHLTRDERVHVTSDTERWQPTRAPGVATHRGKLGPGDVVRVGHVRLTSPLRTVVDLACALPGHEGLAAADRALRTRAVLRQDLLEYAHRQLPGRTRRRTAETVVTWADRRSESAPESHLRWRYIRSALPVPRPQTAVWISNVEHRTDLEYGFALLGAEYDSDEYHAGGRQRRRDRHRYEGFRALGWLLLFVTPDELYGEADAHLHRMSQALSSRGFDPQRLRRLQRPGTYLGDEPGG